MPNESREHTAAEHSEASTPTAPLLYAYQKQLRSIVLDLQSEHDGLSAEIIATARAIESAQQVSGCSSQDASQDAAGAITESISSLIVRLQFADRMYQRMANLEVNLGYLADSLAAQTSTTPSADWQHLLERSRKTFTMQSERLEFDELLGLTLTSDQEKKASTDDETVLF